MVRKWAAVADSARTTPHAPALACIQRDYMCMRAKERSTRFSGVCTNVLLASIVIVRVIILLRAIAICLRIIERLRCSIQQAVAIVRRAHALRTTLTRWLVGSWCYFQGGSSGGELALCSIHRQARVKRAEANARAAAVVGVGQCLSLIHI